MTEGDKVYYKLRIREEMAKARSSQSQYLRHLHLRVALVYQMKIDGMPRNIVRSLEARLREAGIDIEQGTMADQMEPRRKAA